MPETNFASLINQHGLKRKNCSRFAARSLHHDKLNIFIPKDKMTANLQMNLDGIHILVKCDTRERLYLMPEECLYVTDRHEKLLKKLRVCAIHPVREGAFGQKISRAVIIVQSEQVLN